MATPEPVDPLAFAAALWPDVHFYREQREAIYSVLRNDETVLVAGNMLGKDFLAGFLCLWTFLVHREVRIVTTSVKDDHLRVLWGEIGRFIQSSKYPLTKDKGGPLIVNHRDIRKVVEGKECRISYLRGMVSERGEGMAGHHAGHTFAVIDEASGVDDTVYTQMDTWAKRKLIFGNPNECQNFFRRAVKGGDIPAKDDSTRCYRKVIRITGRDSPNVRLALAQQRVGQEVTGEVLVPGVLSWDEYQKRLALWDAVRICVGIDAAFYEGASVLMFPPEWLNRAEALAATLKGRPRKARAIGIDPAEGGDRTAMAAVDDLGLIELASKLTPDTAVVTSEALAFMRRHGVAAENVVFDRGGGGKQHADRLREQGYPVRTVAFGESVNPDPRRGQAKVSERLDQREERYAYVNRRAEMYGTLRDLLDPAADGPGFALPAEYTELRHQLSPIPLLYDREGRMRLLPKNRKDASSKEKTLVELIGHSPDEADATVLAVFGMLHKAPVPVRAGAF